MDKIIDLSQEIRSGMQTFALHSPTHIVPGAPRERYGWTTNALIMNEHAGTHLDAPFHFIAGGLTIDAVSLERLTGAAVVLDMRAKWPKGEICPADLHEATTRRPLRAGDAVLLATGAEGYFGEPCYLDSHAGLSEGCAQLLVDAGVRLVGTDAPSIDHPEAASFPAHHTLLPAGVLVVENLTNLAALIEQAGVDREFTLHTFPLRITGGTGSPIRAVAVVDGR